MAASSDYLKLADETKDVILEYAVQDWPVVKSSVSLFNHRLYGGLQSMVQR